MLMDAHATRLARSSIQVLIIAYIVLFLLLLHCGCGSPDSDSLLKFKESIGNSMALDNWDPATNPCNGNRPNWSGMLCLNGTIWGLQLENMGLTGTIDVDALSSLHSLRTLSLMNNKLDGPLPDVKRLGKLKALYLSNNRFSGQLSDDAFQGMGSLKRLFLANNEFIGKIPFSLTTLPKLMELRLEGNQFQGPIPNFQQKSLKMVNLASNELQGPIPASLSNFTPNSFSGNKELCGPPLATCSPPQPSPAIAIPASAPKKKIDIWKIIAIIILMVMIMLLALAFLLLYWKRRSAKVERTTADNSNKIMASNGGQQLEKDIGQGESHIRRGDNLRLTFLGDSIEKFDLQDLLRASAEVLGSGTFGASYKAVVPNGQAVVVKRYKQMNNVGREEFHEHMRRLGRLKHPNLLPLEAYYYRREEKLLVSAFVENGSLASHLHGNHSEEKQGLDWLKRFKIIKGVAQGLAYLYRELPVIIPHGHLKSSNILLDENFEPLLTDYALRPVINSNHAHQLMIAYKPPECTEQGRASNKTDIWSFGILILEILTGKFPENYLTQGYESKHDLASWVQSMVTEKRTNEVFDKEIMVMGVKNIKGEMINLLKIGLSCCEEDVERRPDIKEVVNMIEELNGGDINVEEECNEFDQGNGVKINGNNKVADGDSFTVDR